LHPGDRLRELGLLHDPEIPRVLAVRQQGRLVGAPLSDALFCFEMEIIIPVLS
jgi:hypothetical protein